MSENITPTTESAPQSAPESVDHSGAQQEAAPPAKPWDGDFDPQRAQKLIENLRSDIEKLKGDKKSYAEKLKAYEDAEKSELQKAQEAAEQYKAQMRDLMKENIIRKHGLSLEDDGEFVFGETVEEMEERAQKLAARVAKKAEPAPAPTSDRPKPKLTPGTGSDDSPITRESLKGMASSKVWELYQSGALNGLLGKTSG